MIRLQALAKTIERYRTREVNLGDLVYGIEFTRQSLESLDGESTSALLEQWEALEIVYASALAREE